MKTTDVYISTLITGARDEERRRYDQIRIFGTKQVRPLCKTGCPLAEDLGCHRKDESTLSEKPHADAPNAPDLSASSAPFGSI